MVNGAGTSIYFETWYTTWGTRFPATTFLPSPTTPSLSYRSSVEAVAEGVGSDGLVPAACVERYHCLASCMSRYVTRSNVDLLFVSTRGCCCRLHLWLLFLFFNRRPNLRRHVVSGRASSTRPSLRPQPNYRPRVRRRCRKGTRRPRYSAQQRCGKVRNQLSDPSSPSTWTTHRPAINLTFSPTVMWRPPTGHDEMRLPDGVASKQLLHGHFRYSFGIATCFCFSLSIAWQRVLDIVMSNSCKLFVSRSVYTPFCFFLHWL